MGARILVVDDSPTIRKVVGAILTRRGYDVHLAQDGLAAFAMLTGERAAEDESNEALPEPMSVDLVLLDFVMPNMNGYQFCRAVRQKPGLSTLPVVLMSAKSDKIRDQFVMQTGAIDAISKPFDSQALVAAIENALRRVETGKASASRLPEIGPDDDFDSSIATAPGGYELKRAKLVADVGAKLGAALAPALASLPLQMQTAENVGSLFTSQLSDDLLHGLGTLLRELQTEDAAYSALSGDIAVIPIGAVLQMLQVEGQSGALTVWNGATEVTIMMRGGLIDLAQSRLAGDEFRLGRYFVEEGLVSSAQIERLLAGDPRDVPPASGSFKAVPHALPSTEEMQVAPPMSSRERDGEPESTRLQSAARISVASRANEPSVFDVERVVDEPASIDSASLIKLPKGTRILGHILLEAGLITEEQLRTALRRQSSELIYEILRWPGGRFEFKREAAKPLALTARLGLTVPAVVMEGFRRVDEWRALEDTLGNFDSILVADTIAVESMGKNALPRTEQVVLDAVDGTRSVREVIRESHMSSFDACRILVQLMEARLVRRRTSP